MKKWIEEKRQRQMMLTFLVASLIKREHAGYRPFDEE